ncbi:hypothetical protein HW511_05225 [Asaia siamensis]|uniref:YD repeat-containing protein n=1 Tax=Asaia siamensis TaxID=110479 RepID=A0ABQ1LHH2_9PROT|nr:hypothetical protein [Asaia siamensis]GGC24671.1 hypothetical protein GCM10007207_07480 [Asaia siamensis]
MEFDQVQYIFWDRTIYKLNMLYKNISYTNNDGILSVIGEFLSSDPGGVTMTMRYDRDAMIAAPALQEAGKPWQKAHEQGGTGNDSPCFQIGSCTGVDYWSGKRASA